MVRNRRLPDRKMLHDVAHAHSAAIRRQQIQNPNPRRISQRLKPSRVLPRPPPAELRPRIRPAALPAAIRTICRAICLLRHRIGRLSIPVSFDPTPFIDKHQ